MSTEVDNRKVEKSDDGRWYVDDGVGVEFFDSWAAAADYLDIVQRLDARRKSAKRRLDAAEAALARVTRLCDDADRRGVGVPADVVRAAVGITPEPPTCVHGLDLAACKWCEGDHNCAKQGCPICDPGSVATPEETPK